MTNKILYKKLDPNAITPTKNHNSDAGYDLYAIENKQLTPGSRVVVKTGIAFAIPEGYVGLIWPRSGLAVKQGINILAGVIDSEYRGEIMVCLHNTGLWSDVNIKEGDRIAQILFQSCPHFDLVETESLEDTERSDKGFGSSGR